MLRKLPPPRRRIVLPDAIALRNEYALPDSQSGAHFREGNHAIYNNGHRILLWRVWDINLPRMVLIMLNPSVAGYVDNDPTIRRGISFAKREGCGGLYVANLSSYISTDPAVLLRMPSWSLMHEDAFRVLAHLFIQADRNRDWKVVVAWGSHKIAKSKSAIVCTLARPEYDPVPLWCLGINKDGNPKHPLYVKGDQPLIPWPAGADWH